MKLLRLRGADLGKRQSVRTKYTYVLQHHESLFDVYHADDVANELLAGT